MQEMPVSFVAVILTDEGRYRLVNENSDDIAKSAAGEPLDRGGSFMLDAMESLADSLNCLFCPHCKKRFPGKVFLSAPERTSDTRTG